jgi:cysteine-rich repeat protein
MIGSRSLEMDARLNAFQNVETASNRPREECDDGTQESNDGCSSKCKIEKGLHDCTNPSGCQTQCGDGYVVEAGCYLSGVPTNPRTSAAYRMDCLFHLPCAVL